MKNELEIPGLHAAELVQNVGKREELAVRLCGAVQQELPRGLVHGIQRTGEMPFLVPNRPARNIAFHPHRARRRIVACSPDAPC
jgi:hypothetical protein